MSTFEPVELTAQALRQWALPETDAQGDKESRGHVLVVAGSREMPGAALLAARAALRSGAGKLSMAVPACIAQGLALQIPEARVIALPETSLGGLALDAAKLVGEVASRAAAILIGPGMQDERSVLPFLEATLPMVAHATLVLDALALVAARNGYRFNQPVVLTPHAGEMASVTQYAKEQIAADPMRYARDTAVRSNAVMVLKGPVTCIAAGDGRTWRHCCSLPGLGTSGSGDVLAGALAGLAAQGAPGEQAAAWAVAAHAQCGATLARRHGSIGYLASEICDALPRALRHLIEAHPSAARLERLRKRR